MKTCDLFRGTRGGVAAFLVIAALLAGGLGWVTWAALRLEAMWNELAAQYPFSMLCAYPVPLVSGDEQQDSLDELRRVHAAVAGAVPAPA